MFTENPQLSTGLPGLDRVLMGVRPGDNVVWQIDAVEDYIPFVEPFARWARHNDKRLIYFRFARHAPLVTEAAGVEIHQLHPEAGFEEFITQCYDIIQDVGEDACYVFDALSELTLDLYSDRMLANFYMITCPHLFALRTVAYYALLKNYHSPHAASPIAATTQILIDVYRRNGQVYVHPLKVKHRYSPTMHMLHAWVGDEFRPVTESCETAEVLTNADWSGIDPGMGRLGGWARYFVEAETTLQAYRRQEVPEERVTQSFQRCLRNAVTRDEKALALAERYLTLEDVLEVKKRMLSSGLIGGKSVGMLLGRAILKRHSPRWSALLEPHDSFYIGSEVFYSFLVHNQCWRLRQKQKHAETLFEGADEARQRMLLGGFPPDITARIGYMLDYFGLSPIIVRSSSLLEDNFGNAFAGKYESVFCANQGPRHIRLEELMQAIRIIYASSMSKEALSYRAARGVLDKDEQMALLVQRVSGGQYGNYFFPHVAGVGYSFNPYVWSKEIDPSAGCLRMVFGLGTRAVGRSDNDYVRLTALNAPTRRPETGAREASACAQRNADILNLQINSLETIAFLDLQQRCKGLPLELLGSRDHALERETGRESPWFLSFEGLLADTPFAGDMREMLAILQDAYGCPVDIEFTLNLAPSGAYRINLLQCRPLQIKGWTTQDRPDLSTVREADILMASRGPLVGPSRLIPLERIVFVDPAAYGLLPVAERYRVARTIGRLCHPAGAPVATFLLGPGRWGTNTPQLGIPTTFREIQPVAAICEIVAMHETLVPDVSLGSHFFGDLIESDILYTVLYPKHADSRLNVEFLRNAPNALAQWEPEAASLAPVIRVIDAKTAAPGRALMLGADTENQHAVCFFDAPK